MNLRFNIPVIAGLILTVVGVLFALQNFGVLALCDVQLYWPLLVVAFGLSRVVEPQGRGAGAALLVVGSAVLFSNLGPIPLPSNQWVRYWPLIVVAAGVHELVRSAEVAVWAEAAAIIFLGAWMQLSYFGVAHLSTFRLWPLVLVVVGGTIVWRGVRRGAG